MTDPHAMTHDPAPDCPGGEHILAAEAAGGETAKRPGAAPPGPAECTCSALRKAARRLSQVYDTALAAQGLKTTQYSLLVTLERWAISPCGAEAPVGPTVQALADRLGLDRTTLGHNLRPLERSGLIVTTPDARDRRIHRLALSEAGRAKIAACRPLWRAAQTRFEAIYGADRTAALHRELDAIALARDGLAGTAARLGRRDILDSSKDDLESSKDDLNSAKDEDDAL